MIYIRYIGIHKRKYKLNVLNNIFMHHFGIIKKKKIRIHIVHDIVLSGGAGNFSGWQFFKDDKVWNNVSVYLGWEANNIDFSWISDLEWCQQFSTVNVL